MDRRLPSLDDAAIMRVRQQLYRSIGDLDEWPEALREVARVVGATGVAMTLPSFDARRGYSFDNVVVNVNIQIAIDHSHESGTLDPWTAGGLRRGFTAPGLILRGPDMCDPKEVARTSWHTAVVGPAEMGDIMTATLAPPRDSGLPLSLAVFHRHRPCDPFELEAVERLRLFTEDLSRSAAVAFELRAARSRSRLLAAALDHVPDAVLVLDGEGRLVFANQCADRFIQSSAVLSIREGKLVASNLAEDRRLREAVLRAAMTGVGTHIAFRLEGAAPIVAKIAPHEDRSAQFSIAGFHGVIVTIASMDGEVAEESLISSALALTPAEARVARLIALGRTLREIAVSHNVSVETIRTQVKSLFGKLGVARQSEIALFVRRIPIR